MQTVVLASDVGFTEGPVWMQDGRIVFTSIDTGKVYQHQDGATTILAVTGGGPNGATEGTDGSVYVSQNSGTRPAHRWPFVTGGVQVIRKGGKVDWLTQDPVSPNDLCFGPDGYLWVTDPTRDGRRADGRLWRCDPYTGESEILVSIHWYPNGIGFGLEDDAGDVADTGHATIERFPIGADRRLGKPETFCRMDHGHPDGFAFDAEGHLVVAVNGADEGAEGEVQVWNLDGKLVETLPTGRGRWCTNLAISEDRRLIVTNPAPGSSSNPSRWIPDEGAVLERSWPYPGLSLHPFRHGVSQ